MESVSTSYFPSFLCSGSSSSVSPLRLHTALSLYSSNLSAVVLLVDDRVNSLTGNKESESVSATHQLAQDTVPLWLSP